MDSSDSKTFSTTNFKNTTALWFSIDGGVGGKNHTQIFFVTSAFARAMKNGFRILRSFGFSSRFVSSKLVIRNGHKTQYTTRGKQLATPKTRRRFNRQIQRFLQRFIQRFLQRFILRFLSSIRTRIWFATSSVRK